jgi:hypothetical protein
MKCHIAALMENNVEYSKQYWERINAEQSLRNIYPCMLGCGINQYGGTVHHDITDYFSCLTSIQTHLCLSISDHKYLSFPEPLCAALLDTRLKGCSDGDRNLFEINRMLLCAQQRKHTSDENCRSNANYVCGNDPAHRLFGKPLTARCKGDENQAIYP